MSNLVEMCCGECGITYAVPVTFRQQRKDRGGTWYCPNGHSRVFRESTVDKLTRERDRLKQDLAYKDDLIAEAKRETATQKGQVTKIKNRLGRGVCPCCNRSFTDLRRHMDTKHPDFTKPELKIVA